MDVKTDNVEDLLFKISFVNPNVPYKSLEG